MGRDRSSLAGFTLIEVLVALAILAGMLSAVMTAVANARAHFARGQVRLNLLLEADALMQRIGSELPLMPASTRGESGDLVWAISIQPYEKEFMPSSAEILEIAVAVWPSTAPAELVVLKTLRMRDP